MYPIKKSGSRFCLSYFPWAEAYPACPETAVTVSWDKGGLDLHFVSYETNLRAEQREHNTTVSQDSCVEAFLQVSPETDERYINLEFNPNCAVSSSIRYDRKRSQRLDPADIRTLSVRAEVFEDRWELWCRVPVAFLQKQVPSYRHEAGAVLRGNFYKCGDLTDHPHYAAFANIPLPSPDFHRPEYFAEFVLTEG